MLAFVILGIILQACFIFIEHKEKYVPAVILKGLASLCFVLLGIACSKGGSYAGQIVAGLILGMAGDILLNLRFVFEKAGKKIFLVGIFVFLLGHVLYLIALLGRAKMWYIPVLLGIVLAFFLLKWIFSKVSVGKAFKVFGIFYVGAVAVMAVTAVWNLITLGGTDALLFAVGGVLFLVSDLILIFNTFMGTTKFSLRIANLSLYYAGQLLIALSLLFS